MGPKGDVAAFSGHVCFTFRTILYGECAARSDGFEPSGIKPAEFGAYIKAEIAKWRRVIEQANMDKI